MRILIPTNFSVLPEYAWILIQKIMKGKVYEVTFLHVMQAPDTVSLDDNKNFTTCGEIDIQYLLTQREIVEKKMKGISDGHQGQVKTDWIIGKLTDAICSYAEQGKYDLIAMGTSGASGLSEWLSGSNTQMVSRKTQIPVLSLMCDRSDWELRNVLFVQDFSKPFVSDMHWLEEILDSESSNMHFLHVEDSESNHQRVMGNMESFANTMRWHNAKFHTIKDTRVENGVIHFNQMNDMDLVVICNNVRKNLFKHSDAENLINHMFKPLITFH